MVFSAELPKTAAKTIFGAGGTDIDREAYDRCKGRFCASGEPLLSYAAARRATNWPSMPAFPRMLQARSVS